MKCQCTLWKCAQQKKCKNNNDNRYTHTHHTLRIKTTKTNLLINAEKRSEKLNCSDPNRIVVDSSVMRLKERDKYHRVNTMSSLNCSSRRSYFACPTHRSGYLRMHVYVYVVRCFRSCVFF